jgi:hypothetical protein
MPDTAKAATDRSERGPRKIAVLAFLAALAALQGCTAVSNPVANGIPVRRLPPELLGESRANMETIPLALLRQAPPDAHKVGPGDILGIWIEGILGERGQAPPVRVSEFASNAPSVGIPFTVRSDGTISLPLIPPLKVDGMTLEQVEDEIRKAYTVAKKIIQPGRASIIVSLQRPRQFHILVIRQDSGTEDNSNSGGSRGFGRTAGFILSYGGGTRGSRKGTGYAIDLPVYENDVLNALTRTGGFPGSDAVNEIIIERGTLKGEQGPEALLRQLQTCPPGAGNLPQPAPGTRRIRIPLRHRPGQPPTIRPEDVILQNGDIVYIEAREADVFYTAGLLPSGEYVLPRDSDLDVVQAILRVGGPILSGGISTTNINGTLLIPGLGNPSPALVSIIRQTPDCGQVTIRVDLDRALRDRRERILIQPKDVLVLQERPEQGIARYFSQVFNVSVFYNFLNSSRAQGNASLSVPNP